MYAKSKVLYQPLYQNPGHAYNVQEVNAVPHSTRSALEEHSYSWNPDPIRYPT